MRGQRGGDSHPRQAVLAQIAPHRPRKGLPLRVILDLTSLEKCGKFWPLSTPTEAPEAPDPWVRVLKGKRGWHLVVLYLVLEEWRVPRSFRVWRGKDHPSPSALACKLLATVPTALSQGVAVIVLADTEFGTVQFLNAVRQRWWRAVVGMCCTRKLPAGQPLNQWYR